MWNYFHMILRPFGNFIWFLKTVYFLCFINQMKELLGSDEDDDTKSSKIEKGYVPKLIGKRGLMWKATELTR